MWLLNDRQLANMTPCIKRAIKWLKHSGCAPPVDLHLEIKLDFNSDWDEWRLQINGPVTYTMAKDKKRWKRV